MWIGDLTLRLRNWIAEVAQDGPFGNHETLTDGLVSYWALDETSGTRYDSVTATGNDLTDNNTVTYVNEGPEGTAASFVAASSESLSSASADFRGDQAFTIAGWVNITGETVNQPIFTRDDGGANRDWTIFGHAQAGGGATTIQAYHLNGAFPTLIIDAGPVGWHFIRLSVSGTGGTMTLSSDTKTPSTTTAATLQTNTANFKIASADAGGFQTMRAARVGFWARELDASDVASLFNDGKGKAYSELTATELTGLVSYFNLDEVGGARYDSHGANDLTDNNTVGSVNSGPEGVVAVFVNANNEVLTNATNVMPADSNFTAVAWTRLRSAATGHSNELFTTGDGDFILRCNGEYPQIVGRGFADSAYWNGGAAIPVEQWKMLTGWHDADNNQFGISVDNGVRTTVASGGANGAGTAIAVGARDSTPTDTTETDGDISRVGCWTRVLTADEQNTLFNGGVGLRYSELPAGLLVGLVSYWDLTETSGTRSDSHGTNHLTDNNTVGYTLNRPNFGVSANFVAGSSEYLNRASVDLTGCNTTGFSLSMWYKATGDEYWLYCRDDVTDREVVMGRQSGAIRWAPFDDVNDMAGSADAGDDAWSHILVTWDPADNKPRLYTNGGAAVVGGAGSDFFTDTVLVLGGRPATATFITGQIGPTALWNRVLTAQERADLFNAGRGLFYND